jgi:hypothetical protein
MAQYLILLYDNEASWATAPEAKMGEMLAQHSRFQEQLAGMGAKILGSNALQPTNTATSVRGDVVTDGPFVETKEALGGYYLIEARDLDHALAVAKLCPVLDGGVEVRPVWDVNADAAA